MSENSSIEWTDATWNPVTGCTKVSAGCQNCYAETWDRRFQRDGPFVPWTVKAQRQAGQPAVTLHPERLDQPLRWKKPRMVFVNSMSDLFHEDVPDEFIWTVFGIMALASHHTFQVLTKRPDRMTEMFNQGRLLGRSMVKLCVSYALGAISEYERTLYPVCDVDWDGWPLPNVWLGVSVENQRAADERIPLLVQTPAVLRFISAEPLLGPVDLTPWLQITQAEYDAGLPENQELDWVIVGGESGPRARPMHPQWVRNIRDQCQAAGVPFFFKQWGEWRPLVDEPLTMTWKCVQTDGTFGYHDPNYRVMAKVGKGKAGRLLDGRTWDEYPQGANAPTPGIGAVANS